jgi:hypothetical protein
VKVVRIDDLDECPLAVIVHYGCHPTIMGHPNRLITPDYPGIVRQVVEHATGATCLFLLGYLPTAEAYPDRGYEVDTSPFRPGAGEQIVEGSLALLAALRA